MQEFIAIFNAFGPWGGMVVTALWLYSRKHIATGRELQQEVNKNIELQAERERERDDFRRRITELQHEKQFWQDIALTSTRITDQVVNALPTRKEPT